MLTKEQMESMLAYLCGYDGDAFDAAYNHAVTRPQEDEIREALHDAIDGYEPPDALTQIHERIKKKYLM